MVNAERAGYFVITPFALTGGGWVLVNRGWVPLGASRAERPAIPVAGDTRAGARPRRPYAESRHSDGHQGGARPALSRGRELSQPCGNRAAAGRILLDLARPIWCCSTPASPMATCATWAAPGFPPMRHIGYAVQWFALALTLAVIYVVTNLRRDARHAGGMIAERPRSPPAASADRRGADVFCAPGAGLLFVLRSRYWHPGGRVNAGELIEPARPLPALALPLLGAGTPIRISSRASGHCC